MEIDVKVEAEFLSAILQKSEAVDSELLSYIEPEYFQIDSYQWFARVLKNRDWEPIAFDFLDQQLLTIEDEEKRSKYRNQLYALYVRQLTFEADAADKFKAYVAFCTVNSKVRDAFQGFQRTDRIDFLINDVAEGIDIARSVITEGKLPVVDYVESYQDRQHQRKMVRDNPNLNPRILTGIVGLDQQFRLKAPMIIDFIAPFKRYKSIVLNALGYSFLLQGWNAIHVTYENSLELTMDRYDSMFSELNYDRISNLLITQEEKDAMDATFEWMRSWKNRLYVIKATPQETTVPQINDEIKRIQDKTGETHDVEVWDYLNIIAPSKDFREERHQQKQIVWDLKNHAEEHGVAIFEASQSNLEGAKSERLDIGHRGLSTDISRGIDISIAIDQTKAERAEGIIVLSPLFFRAGPITIPEIVLDTDLPRMVITRQLHRLWQVAASNNPYI